MKFNLITDAWIPVRRQDGKPDTIAPHQVVEQENPVVEMRVPRPDFQGALYQFLIGLLQTCFAPNEDEWLKYWKYMPDVDELKTKFEQEQVNKAFELYNPDGPAFMQEHPNTRHPDKKKMFDGVEWCPIEDLIGGELSENTRKKNKDLFTKSGRIKVVSPYWAALALFNVQTSGVLAWGKHRIGLRGNAPLTTLLIPDDQNIPLWHHLWLNVISKEQGSLIQGDWSKKDMADIFPWMGITRISPGKKPSTSPQDANPLQHYWPMPRRIHLRFEPTAPDACCDLTGERIDCGVSKYKRVTDGVYYTNGWVHPLSPHTRTGKNRFPKPVDGRNAGQGLRQWVSLNYDEYTDEDEKTMRWGRALVVQDFYDNKPELGIKTKLWCFGYDADSANVRCWYESSMPTFHVSADNVDALKAHATDALQLAQKMFERFRMALIRAWFKPQRDSKGKESWSHITKSINKAGHLSSYKNIDYEYWEALEPHFITLLEEIIQYGNTEGQPMDAFKAWLKAIRNYCKQHFDQYALKETIDGSDMKRVVQARNDLFKVLHSRKDPLLKSIDDYEMPREVNP